jgi:hypothetical protein
MTENKIYKHEDGFTNKDFPEPIIKKIMGSGIMPITGHVKVFDGLQFIEGMDKNFSGVSFYSLISSKDWKLRTCRIEDFIPAFNAEQLWDYLEKYRHFKVNNAKGFKDEYKIDIAVSTSKLNHVSLELYEIVGIRLEAIPNSFVSGKLTDPSVPARMLIELNKRGILK